MKKLNAKAVAYLLITFFAVCVFIWAFLVGLCCLFEWYIPLQYLVKGITYYNLVYKFALLILTYFSTIGISSAYSVFIDKWNNPY